MHVPAQLCHSVTVQLCCRVVWWRVLLDEAQNIKNQHAQRSLAVFDLKVIRLCRVQPLSACAIVYELVIATLTLLAVT